MGLKVILFANTPWYLYNFRLALACSLRRAGFDVLLVSPPGEFSDRLVEAGFRWVAVPLERRSVNPLTELKAIYYLYRLFRREMPFVVHNFTVKCVLEGGVAAAAAGVPATVNAVAGMGYIFSSKSFKARLLRPLIRLLLSRVVTGRRSRLILQNSDDVDAFVASGVADENRIHLIKGSGVDLERFRPREKKRFSGVETRVLLAARLLWDKGVAVYVDAAMKLRQMGLPIRLSVAGSYDQGNPGAIPQDVLDQWRQEGFVDFLGHVDDMATLFSEVDIVVLPTWYGEGVPRSLVEAAACALPLIATNIPGCTEIISDGVGGILIPVRNSDALADAIRKMHENPEWARALGLAARERALNEFDENIVIRRTLDVYRELGC